jgi:hypothetical protein
MSVAKRVSSLLVTADLPAVSAYYRELGLTRVESDDRGCVGYVAGETGVLLADMDFAVRCWGAETAAALAGRFVPYVYLDELGSESDRPRRLLTDTRTWFGTHERVVDTVSGPVVLVEVSAS